MATYSVYLPPERNSDFFDRMRLVSDSKAPIALVFPPFWLIWHRLWFELLIYTALVFAIGLLAIWAPVMPVFYLSAIPGFYLLLEGNELIRNKLERNGWHFVGLVDASNEEEAEIKFLVENESKLAMPQQSRSTGHHKVPLGRPVAIGLFPE